MIETEYKGYKLNNAVSAIVMFYPKVSNGSDLIKDIQEAPNSLTTLCNLYCAFRMSADHEARKKSLEELVNEIDYSDLMATESDFYKTINLLINGEKSTAEKHS